MQHAPHRHLRATATVLAATALTVAGVTGAGPASARPYHSHGTAALPACTAADPANCGALFDDFNYASSSDPQLTANGWTVRSGEGGPGVKNGATWQPSNITFPIVDGQQSMDLAMQTDGTSTGTTNSEISRTDEDAFAGTYAARIKFTDAPAAGTDGDHLVETFFAYSSSATAECDSTYSENDFSEYLPNGGYGEPRTFNSQTTWASTGNGCSVSQESDQYASLAGWHTVMSTVDSGHVKYFIDGVQVADHSGAVYPRRNMAIDFNLWLLDLTGHSGTGTSTWHEDVDYVYYGENRVLTSAQVTDEVNTYRAAQRTYVDTIGAA
ncbi:glycoside hydrolase family 16 protein [Curtobacterium flaccumfaciens]|nr:glycoside hydrolase family 16 protein [Curtobacterium flaccumfaciens]